MSRIDEEERNERLRKISYELREILEQDEDSGGPLVGSFDYYEQITEFTPKYRKIPSTGLLNRIRKHFYRTFTVP